MNIYTKRGFHYEKKYFSVCLGLLTYSLASTASAAYINETLGINNNFNDAQFIDDTFFTKKFDVSIDNPINRYSSRNISQNSPHASILGTGDINTTTDYFSFNASRGSLVLDIDNGIDSGGSFDSWLKLYDSSFNLVASNDDALVDNGSVRSFTGSNFQGFSYDSFLKFQVTTDELFYVVVGSDSDVLSTGISFGNNYTLHISNDAVGSINPSPIPLPASIWLFLSGLAGFTAMRRKS